MRSKSFIPSIAVAAVFSVLLIFGSEADAKSVIPVWIDDVACSVVDGDTVWIAPVGNQAALEAHTGMPAAVGLVGDLLAAVPPAALGHVRFEACYATPSVVQTLNARGYFSRTDDAGAIEDSDGASVWTD